MKVIGIEHKNFKVSAPKIIEYDGTKDISYPELPFPMLLKTQSACSN